MPQSTPYICSQQSSNTISFWFIFQTALTENKQRKLSGGHGGGVNLICWEMYHCRYLVAGFCCASQQILAAVCSLFNCFSVKGRYWACCQTGSHLGRPFQTWSCEYQLWGSRCSNGQEQTVRAGSDEFLAQQEIFRFFFFFFL